MASGELHVKINYSAVQNAWNTLTQFDTQSREFSNWKFVWPPKTRISEATSHSLDVGTRVASGTLLDLLCRRTFRDSEDRHDGSPCRTRMGHSQVTIAARSEAAKPPVVCCSDWRLVFSFLFLKRTLSRSWNQASYEVGALCSPLTVWTAWFLLTRLMTKLLSPLKTTFISHDFTCSF